jgi:hypothetical protein
MDEHSIPFSAPMILAYQQGRKTQTRRVAKNRKHPDVGCDMAPSELICEEQHVIDRACPYGQPGDLLWFREGLRAVERAGELVTAYAADGVILRYQTGHPIVWAWKKPYLPSIFMPRWACRHEATIEAVRLERLQDIGESAAMAEGVERMKTAGLTGWKIYSRDGVSSGKDFEIHQRCAVARYARESYRTLWEALNGRYSWDANPIVWVVAFKPAEASR